VPTKKLSAKSPNGSKKLRAKHTALGKSIIRGMQELQAHIRGEIQLRTRMIYVPDDVDVHSIREKSGLSQSQFAARYGFNPRTLQDWEQGRSQPDSAVRAYLTVIDRNPAAVEQALAS
jgi:putative transcriptional regulator